MDTARAEAAIEHYCRTARLSPVQTEMVILHLVDGWTAREIRRKLKIKRVSEVQALLEGALRRITPLAGWRELLRTIVRPDQFQRLFDADDRELTTQEAMRGPRSPAPLTPQVGLTWTTVCVLPGAPLRTGVRVTIAETIRRWW